MNKNRLISVLMLTFLLATAVFGSFSISADAPDLRVSGHARPSIRTGDLVVTTHVLLSHPDSDELVQYTVTVRTPNDETYSITAEVSATDRNLRVEDVFSDVLDERGFYYVTLSAEYGEHTDTYSFKLDPPGGTMGPPLR